MKKIIYPEIRAVHFHAQDIVTASDGLASTHDKPGYSETGYEGGYAPSRNIWGDSEGTTRLF